MLWMKCRVIEVSGRDRRNRWSLLETPSRVTADSCIIARWVQLAVRTVAPGRRSVQTGMWLDILRISTGVRATTAAAVEGAPLLLSSHASGCPGDAVIASEMGQRVLQCRVNLATSDDHYGELEDVAVERKWQSSAMLSPRCRRNAETAECFPLFLKPIWVVLLRPRPSPPLP